MEKITKKEKQKLFESLVNHFVVECVIELNKSIQKMVIIRDQLLELDPDIGLRLMDVD